MNMAQVFIQELKQEASSTRKLLERVPEQHFDWKPHQKSMSMGELASHIVDILSWTHATVKLDVFEMEPGSYEAFRAKNRDDLLKTYDEKVRESERLIGETSDEQMMRMWEMKVGGQSVFKMPRAVVLRAFILNHTIHHRGQLDVYLRLKDVPLPQIYGPTADEPDMIPRG